MPTDVALSTNSATGALELRQVQAMPDGSGYAMFVVVRSGGFAAALPFFVTTASWCGFAKALGGVGAVDGAPAQLRARTGDDVIAVVSAGEGQVAVSGVLSEPDDDQRLHFRFVTSAEGLSGLAGGVTRVE